MVALDDEHYLAFKVNSGGADEVAFVVRLLHGNGRRLAHHGGGGVSRCEQSQRSPALELNDE